jgi:hypothetical protein
VKLTQPGFATGLLMLLERHALTLEPLRLSFRLTTRSHRAQTAEGHQYSVTDRARPRWTSYMPYPLPRLKDDGPPLEVSICNLITSCS